MRVAKLSPSQGLAWIPAGWQLFRLQPVNYATLLASYLFLLLIAMLGADLLGEWSGAILPAAWAGAVFEGTQFLLLAFIPGLSIGFLEASRTALRGVPIYPTALFKAFAVNRRTTLALFALGLLQIGLVLLISYAVVSPHALSGAVDANGNFDLAKLPPDEAMAYAESSILNVLATLPVYLAFWYAPVLIAWHGMSIWKALFFSSAAVWRNLWAFLAYGCGWFVAGSLVLGTVGTLVALLGLGSSAVVVAVPVALVIISVIYCSVYASYSTVFLEDPVVPTPAGQ